MEKTESLVVLETVQWSSLPDVDELEPVGDRDHAVLAEMGEVLRRHGYTQRFGICLLHRHFELGDDEVALEVTDVEARVSTVMVIKKSDDGSTDRLETMWRFKHTGDTEMVTKCEKTCDKDNGHKRRHIKVGR
ncbi:hypothetical protein RHECNPAF_178008 [Rhizobium etli CNPAF512]|nr:hypothetical protein RHECNPAF_178008 [Rhizobium etli CNPAF512]